MIGGNLVLLAVLLLAACSSAAKRLAGQGSFLVLLQENGEAYGSGLNGDGQLGVKPDSRDSIVRFPIKVAGVENAKDVCAGWTFACFVMGEERSVSCLGNGAYGKLGRDSEDDSHELAPAVGLEKAVDEVVCSESAFALKAGATEVYAWGNNDYGMLGLGHANPVLVPTALDLSFTAPDTKVLEVGTGFSFNCFLTSAGKVFCAGSGYFGQLGGADTSDKDRPTPIVFADVETTTFTSLACGGYEACASTSAGLVYCWGDFYQGTPMPVPGITTASFVWASWVTAFAVLQDGTAMAIGNDHYGQMGTTSVDLPIKASPVPFGQGVGGIVEIKGGELTACILNTAGEVWCAGSNEHGVLGLGDEVKNSSVLVPWTIVPAAETTTTPTSAPVASTSAPTPPADKACLPVKGLDKEGCAKLSNTCSKSKVTMAWAGAGCRVNGKLQQDGGCQCKGYCGYTCSKSCNLSSGGRCKWNSKLKVCTVAKTSKPYVVRDTPYCPVD